MNEIDLRRLDLNLLVVFDVLMTERSVTRAAERLARTQSAVSHALQRLREQVGDPILVKQGGHMVASPYAERLVADLRPLLDSVRRVLGRNESFHPRTTTRTFRVALPDLNDTLFPRFAKRVRAAAPGAGLEWVVRDDAIASAIADGMVDLALVPAGVPLGDGVAFGDVPVFHWASFVRRGHPAIGKWNHATWAAYPHVAVRVGERMPSPVELVAQGFDAARHVAVRVPHFSAVPPLLASSDLIATLPMMTMFDRLRPFRLVALPAPIPVPPMPHRLIWSRRLDADPGLRWLRARMTEALSEVAAAADAAMP